MVHVYQLNKTSWSFKMKTVCKICGKLVTKKNILRHVQSHGDKNFTCNICDKQFSTRDYLNQHTKTHWQPEELKCSLCSSSFFSRSSLRKHRIRVHERKRFQCPYCQKKISLRKTIVNNIFWHVAVLLLLSAHHVIKLSKMRICYKFTKRNI